ncbi:MAG TPA: efflux RND transporter periplasmic adaptor subunit [Bryobacteraceae bacterium]|nr:efflux RND transporter periplasmic adaptor subunit [Bryobacteraceae bacterium]
MRSYKVAFFTALTAAIVLGGAAGYLFYQARPQAAQRIATALTSGTTPPASPVPESAPSAQSSEGTDPKLLPVQLTPQRMQSIGVKTGVVEFKGLHQDIRATGNVEVDETRLAWVQVRFSGWIQQVFVDAMYKPVEKGQRLFTIYSPEISATEQEYLLARENRDLLGRSTVPGVASGSDSLLKSAAERLKQWQIPDRDIAALDAGGSVPKEIEIDSPVSGVITERNAFATAYVQPGTKLYTIADLSTVWVYAQVFQDDIGRIRIGDPATVTTDAWPGHSFPGRVSFIQPQVDEATRTLKVRIEIPNPPRASGQERRLSPGMFVNVNLDAPLGRQLTIPAAGVFQSGTRNIAFVDRGGGYFEPREIETGDRAGDELVVVKGLKAGEHIVTSANFLIDSESQLQAAMGSFAPPPPGAGAAASMNTATQISLDYSSAPSPPRPGSNVFRVKLTGAGGIPVTGAQVTVTYFMAAMPAMGMAAMRTVATLSDKGGGMYEGPGQVQMSGTWQVTVVATKGGQTLAQKQLDVSTEGK